MSATTTTTTPVAGAMSNNQMTYADLSKSVAALGAAEGKGSQSRSALAVQVTRAANFDIIKPDAAEEIWKIYQTKAREARQSTVTGAKPSADFVAVEEDANDSDKVQVSKLRTFIKLGQMPVDRCGDPVGILTRAGEMIANGTVKKVRTYDGLVSVARAQLKADHELSNIEIQSALQPDQKEKEEKDETALLEAMVKDLEKIRDGKTDKDGNILRPPMPSSEIDAAIRQLRMRLASLNIASERAKLVALHAA